MTLGGKVDTHDISKQAMFGLYTWIYLCQCRKKNEKRKRSCTKYIGRYLSRLAIAEYRITNYDGDTVEFWYEDHQTGKRIDVKVSVFEFLRKLLQHIPPKHFPMVGRFGLYSRYSYHKANQVLLLYSFMRTKQLSLILEGKKKRKTYRQRMIEAFGNDPFICPCCNREMELVEIYHKNYEILYHYMEDMNIIKGGKKLDNKKKEQDEIQKALELLKEEDITITFKCIDCGQEDEVPDFVVDELAYGLEKEEEVETVCPYCNGTMRQASHVSSD